MTDKKLCKSCCKFKQTDNGIYRIDARGNKQFRCAECVQKAKVAHLPRKTREQRMANSCVKFLESMK